MSETVTWVVPFERMCTVSEPAMAERVHVFVELPAPGSQAEANGLGIQGLNAVAPAWFDAFVPGRKLAWSAPHIDYDAVRPLKVKECHK